MKHRPTEGAHDRARTLRGNPTEAEKRIWRMLRSKQAEGVRFRRQAPTGSLIVDFVSHEAKLILEVDGGQHDPASEREASRTAFPEGQGYRVLRFWNNEVLKNPEGVYDAITTALRAGKSSPLRGEGRVGVIPLPARSPQSPNPLDHHPHPTLPHQGGGLSCESAAPSPPPKPSPLKGEGST
jgi:very-short-patch-repair endonuclease